MFSSLNYCFDCISLYNLLCIYNKIYPAMHQVCLCKHWGNRVTRSAATTLGQGSNLLLYQANLSCLVALIIVLIASPCTIFYVFITRYILQCIRYVYANTGEIVSPDLQQQLWAKGQPNNLGEVDAEKGEDCVEFRTSWFPQHHHWNDATCSDEIESICEMWLLYIK